MRIHHRESFDKWIAAASDPLACTGNHWLGNVDAGDFRCHVVVVERKSGADADFKNPSTDFTRGSRGGAPAVDEDWPTENVVDGRPTGIGFFHHLTVGVVLHNSSRITSTCRDEDVTSLCDSRATGRSSAATGKDGASVLTAPLAVEGETNERSNASTDQRAFAPMGVPLTARLARRLTLAHDCHMRTP